MLPSPQAATRGTDMTRDNILYLVIGALVVVSGVLGYMLYQERNQPKAQIKIGPLSIEAK
jgi:predicted negative regulator of RcsB-dependent stress response